MSSGHHVDSREHAVFTERPVGQQDLEQLSLHLSPMLPMGRELWNSGLFLNIQEES